MTGFEKLLSDQSQRMQSNPSKDEVVSASSDKDLKEQLLARFSTFVGHMTDDEYWDDFNFELCDFIQFGGPSSTDAGVFDKNCMRDKALVMPRGSRKTTTCTILYPLWRMLRNSDLRILMVLNTLTNARAKLGKIKQMFENDPRIYGMFPEVIPNFARTTWTDSRLIVNRNIISEDASFECAGVGTAVTSRHFDLAILDDPTSPEREGHTGDMLFPSQKQVEKVVALFKLLLFLLDNPRTREQLVVTTRWGDFDIIDYIRRNRTNFAYFERKASTEGGAQGTPLMNRFPTEVLEQMKVDLGPVFYSCLMDNTPLQGEQRPFKEDDIQYFKEGMRFVGEPGTVVVVVDPAMGKKKQEGCHTGLLVGEIIEEKIVIRHSLSDYLNPSQTCNKVCDFVEDFGATRVGIEDVACQMMLQEPLKTEMYRRRIDNVFIDSIKVGTRSKDERTEALQPLVNNHQVWLHEKDSALRTQLLSYPFATKRDVLDCLALLKQRYYRRDSVINQIAETRKPVEMTRDCFNEVMIQFADEAYKRRNPKLRSWERESHAFTNFRNASVF